MFDIVRKHNKWLMPLLAVLVVVPLVLTGVIGFTQLQNGREPEVAKVDGEPILQHEAEESHRERVGRLAQMLGANADPRILDSEAQRAISLDNLIDERTIAAQAQRLRMKISDERLREVIGQIPQFQLNGQFDRDTYDAQLRSRGWTGQFFDDRVRKQLVRQELEGDLALSAIVPHSVVARLEEIDRSRRTVRLLQFPADKLMAQVHVPDAAVQADYDASKDRYRTPETANVELAVLRLEDIADTLPVAEADARAFYQQNLTRWSSPEQRRASHILITFGKDGSAPDKAAARKIADDVLHMVQAKPGDFARIARERSKDAGSASQGGDLGWFGRGDMVKPFSDAAFALKEGQLSGVVESEFGFHVLQVTGVRGGSAKSFEDVRASIESELRRQSAQKLYAEAAESFTNMVYEQADSLDEAAKKFHITLRHVDGITRDGPLPPQFSAWFPPAVREAIFSPDSLSKHHNTKALEAGANTLVSARVVGYTPASVRPLAEVRAQILSRLQRDQALQMAQKQGSERLAALQKQPDDAGFESAREVSRRDPALPAATLNEVFGVASASLPHYLGAELPGSGYVIVKVVSAGEGPAITADAHKALESQLAERAAQADALALHAALRDRLGVKVLTPPAAKPAAAG